MRQAVTLPGRERLLGGDGVTLDWVPAYYLRDLLLTDMGLTGILPAPLGSAEGPPLAERGRQ